MNHHLVSLFTGCGGLDLGLEMAGFETIIANELEPQACESLRRNKVLCNLNSQEVDDFINDSLGQRCFAKISKEEKALFFDRLKRKEKGVKYLQSANIFEGDIRKIPSENFQELIPGEQLFAIAGGPPCQPFSKAGKQKSLDCTKNGDLFYEFVRLVRDLTPQWFIFENVKGITFTKTDVVYADCKQCNKKTLVPFKLRQDFKSTDSKGLTKCPNCNNENAAFVIINEPGGSLKIILNEFEKIGYTCCSKVLNAADFGAPQIRERLIIVGTNTGKKFTWPEPTHFKPTRDEIQPELFHNLKKKQWATMLNTIWRNGHPKYGKTTDKSVLWVKNVVRPHAEPVTWNLNRHAPTIGAHQAAKLAYAPNGVPEQQLARQQWHTLGHRQGDTPPVFVEHSYLSDEELLTLQTFPSWWYLHGTRMQRAFQIGNAVPPILGKVIGESVIKSHMSVIKPYINAASAIKSI